MVTGIPPPHEGDAAMVRFIEDFAGILAESGIPPMPARVFVALLATDSGRLTAAELAQVLHVSPAAVSGAVRYLIQLNMAKRERVPGSRRVHYRLYDDVLYQQLRKRNEMLARWADSLREGVELVGPDTPAGARLADTVAYVEFLTKELPVMLDAWWERKMNERAGQRG